MAATLRKDAGGVASALLASRGGNSRVPMTEMSCWLPRGVNRTYDIQLAPIRLLTCGNAPRLGGCFWLREGDRNRRFEQFERAGLDRGWNSYFLYLLAVEIDGLPAEGGQVAEQVTVTVNWEPVFVLFS